jgi:hypothetical protein
MADSEICCRGLEPPIVGPDPGTWFQQHRGKEVHVYVSQPLSHQGTGFDKKEHFAVRSYGRSIQALDTSKYLSPIAQVPTCEFAQHHRMSEHQAVFQGRRQASVSDPQMVDPDRGVNKNQFSSLRRRGTSSSPGSVPPSCASLRAFSRSMSALSPARRRAARSFTPVTRSASSNSSSSNVTVVRILMPRCETSHHMMRTMMLRWLSFVETPSAQLHFLA